jgi:hypothetical protein
MINRFGQARYYATSQTHIVVLLGFLVLSFRVDVDTLQHLGEIKIVLEVWPRHAAMGDGLQLV